MRLVVILCSAALLTVVGNLGAAPLAYTGGDYAQNFDTLPISNGIADPFVSVPGRGPHNIDGQIGTTGMDGWTMSNPEELGSSSGNTEYRAQDGSLAGSNGRGIVSFGVNDSSERSLGTLATSNQINRFGLSLINNTGAPLTQVDIAFTGEQWRRGNIAAPGNLLTFAYAVTGNLGDGIDTNIFTEVTELSYSSPNTQVAPDPTEVAIDGNAAANQVALSHTIGGISWGPGQMLMFRWTGQDVTGQDDGLSIDNLRVTPGVPEPATAIFAGIAAMSMALLHRRRSVN
jgi:hypothetical protein